MSLDIRAELAKTAAEVGASEFEFSRDRLWFGSEFAVQSQSLLDILQTGSADS